MSREKWIIESPKGCIVKTISQSYNYEYPLSDHNFRCGQLLKCVVPENIHTPTMEGILMEAPLLLLGISIFQPLKYPPTSPEFPLPFCTTPIPSGKIVLARECIKVKVNTPNIERFALHITTQSIVTSISEDTCKESIQHFSDTCFKWKDKMLTCQITFLHD